MSKKKSPPLDPKASDPGLSNADIALLRLHFRTAIEQELQRCSDEEVREYCRANITDSSSLDSLFRAMTALGYDIEITVKQRTEQDTYARVTSNLLDPDESDNSLN